MPQPLGPTGAHVAETEGILASPGSVLARCPGTRRSPQGAWCYSLPSPASSIPDLVSAPHTPFRNLRALGRLWGPACPSDGSGRCSQLGPQGTLSRVLTRPRWSPQGSSTRSEQHPCTRCGRPAPGCPAGPPRSAPKPLGPSWALAPCCAPPPPDELLPARVGGPPGSCSYQASWGWCLCCRIVQGKVGGSGQRQCAGLWKASGAAGTRSRPSHLLCHLGAGVPWPPCPLPVSVLACFWGYPGPHRHLCHSVFRMKGQSELASVPDACAWHPGLDWGGGFQRGPAL